jgi:periplasmic protein TonB
MAYARANMFYERESWRKPLLISLGFHAFIVLVIVVLGFVMEPRHQTNWGENQGDAVSATLVSGAPIPIPKPQTQTENIVANESKGVTETAPPPKPAETEDGISIPGKVVKPKPEKTVTESNVKPRPMATPTVTASNVKPRPMPTPETAVPYGEGGPVSGPFGTFSAPNTKGGFSFQNADFGSKYGWYVDVVRRKVQSNWLLYEIDPHINAPHRAYISFEITRNGSPANVHITQSSGVPSLDTSARRAIERVDTFGPLPAGNSVQVEFWFDYPPK